MSGANNGNVMFLRPGDLLRRGVSSYILITKVFHQPLTMGNNGLEAAWRADGYFLGHMESVWFTTFTCKAIIRDGIEYDYEDLIREYILESGVFPHSTRY